PSRAIGPLPARASWRRTIRLQARWWSQRKSYCTEEENFVILASKVTFSHSGLGDSVEARRTAVRHLRLTPHLDRERHRDEGAVEPEQAFAVIGQAVHVELLEVCHRRVHPRQRGVVESL